MAAKQIPEGFEGPVNDNGFGLGIFDPFGLGANMLPALNIPMADDGSDESLTHRPPSMRRLTRSAEKEASVKIIEQQSNSSPEQQKVVVIPPKLMVKFIIHEEVSSHAILKIENEGSSEITVEGKLFCQIQSSDALNNSPFALLATTLEGGRIDFQHKEDVVSASTTSLTSIPAHKIYVVNIPKNEIGKVNLGSYVHEETVRHMPILVERKGKLKLKPGNCVSS